MGQQNILIAQPVDEARLRAMRESAPGAVFECRDPIPPGTVLPAEYLRDRTVLFADQCPANVDAMTSLRWIQLGSAGYQQLAGVPLPPGVKVSNASGVNDIPIAEWCLLMMFSFLRDYPAILRRQRDHQWDRDVQFQSELRGRRVGIFGYGNIGREVARLCRAVGLEIWALSRSPIGPRPGRYQPGDPADTMPDRSFTVDGLPDFLRDLDFLILTAPLTDHTRGFFGAPELKLLPRHAVVLNPARAHIIDETALLQALRDGVIAGAGLDSHYREPMPPDDPFWDAPNTVITPHVSGSNGSTHFTTRLWDLFSRNIERFLAGEPLLNEIPSRDLP